MASSGKSPGSSAGSLPGSFRKLWNQTSWSSTNDGNGSAQSPQSQSQAHSQSEIIGSGSRTPRQGQRQGQGAPWGKTRVGGRSGRMGLGPGEREGGGEGDGEGAGDGESQDLVQLMMQLEDDTHHQARELHAQLARVSELAPRMARAHRWYTPGPLPRRTFGTLLAVISGPAYPVGSPLHCRPQ